MIVRKPSKRHGIVVADSAMEIRQAAMEIEDGRSTGKVKYVEFVAYDLKDFGATWRITLTLEEIERLYTFATRP